MTTKTTNKTCLSCKYWAPTDSASGECHRNAPQTVSFEISAGKQLKTVFPTTSQDDWCGEHQEK